MITGAVIGFLVWAGLIFNAAFHEGRFGITDCTVMLVALTGTGASIGWLVS